MNELLVPIAMVCLALSLLFSCFLAFAYLSGSNKSYAGLTKTNDTINDINRIGDKNAFWGWTLIVAPIFLIGSMVGVLQWLLKKKDINAVAMANMAAFFGYVSVICLGISAYV